MIRSLFLSFIALSIVSFSPLLCHGALAADREAVNGIAAVVNGEVITYSQVRDLVEPRERLLRSQYSGDELIAKIKEARSAALQDLIDRQLIVQAFNKESFQIPEHFIDERVDEVIKESFGGDRNTFIKTLQAQNFSMAQFKKLEREKIIVQAMRGKNVKVNTVIPPAKVDEFYAQHRELFTSKEQVKLRMIMVPGHEGDASSGAQKALAEEILGKLVRGADFARMAQMYSEDSTRELGGDWGWIDRKTLAPPLEKVAFNLPTGKISNIIPVGGNFYILKVEEKNGGVTLPLAKVREEIEKKLRQDEVQRLQERWLSSLRQKAYIKKF